MTAQIIDLSSKRPNVYEWMYCLFCGTRHLMVHRHDPLGYFGPCPGCDEQASVPEWRLPPRIG